MQWHVRLTAGQLDQIETVAKQRHDLIRVIEGTNKFEYGYPPAMIVERAYLKQRPLDRE